MKKTQYCRIVKSDGTIFAEHFYLPSDLEEVLAKVREIDPHARVQWLWAQYEEEWREELEWAEREGLAAFLAAQVGIVWDEKTQEQKDKYRDLAEQLLPGPEMAGINSSISAVDAS